MPACCNVPDYGKWFSKRIYYNKILKLPGDDKAIIVQEPLATNKQQSYICFFFTIFLQLHTIVLLDRQCIFNLIAYVDDGEMLQNPGNNAFHWIGQRKSNGATLKGKKKQTMLVQITARLRSIQQDKLNGLYQKR